MNVMVSNAASADAAERIWDVLENYKAVAEALEDSNESVLSHRLNESLRVLTAWIVRRHHGDVGPRRRRGTARQRVR